jgi:proline iminopeptidase
LLSAAVSSYSFLSTIFGKPTKRMKKIFAILLLMSCSESPTDKDGLVEVEGNTSLYYRMIGKGEPVIIIHGGPMLDQSYLFDHFKALAKDHTLIFYDQRVSGKSSATADSTSLTMTNMVNDIEIIREKLKLDQVHIIGHSWGGFLAARYAGEHPPKIKSLILCDAMPPTQRLWQQEEIEIAKRITHYDSAVRDTIMSLAGFKKKTDVTLVDSLMKVSFKTQFVDTMKLSKLKVKLPNDYFQRSKIFSYIGREFYAFDITEQLKRVIAPTLIIYGDQEPALKISAPVYKENIADSKITVIKQSGHFPFIEQPDDFVKAVEEFWRGVK